MKKDDVEDDCDPSEWTCCWHKVVPDFKCDQKWSDEEVFFAINVKMMVLNTSIVG